MKSLFLLSGTQYKLRHKLIILENLNICSGIAVLAIIKCCLGVTLVAITNSRISVAEHKKCCLLLTHVSKTNGSGAGSGPLFQQAFSDHFSRLFHLQHMTSWLPWPLITSQQKGAENRESHVGGFYELDLEVARPQSFHWRVLSHTTHTTSGECVPTKGEEVSFGE